MFHFQVSNFSGPNFKYKIGPHVLRINLHINKLKTIPFKDPVNFWSQMLLMIQGCTGDQATTPPVHLCSGSGVKAHSPKYKIILLRSGRLTLNSLGIYVFFLQLGL